MRSSSRQRRIENGNVVVNQEEKMKTQKNSLYMPYDMEKEPLDVWLMLMFE